MTLEYPIRYTPDVEDVKDDETDTVEKLNSAFDTILETTAEDYGHAVRSVHAKAHGILRGVLTIDGDLPVELAQGMFAKPGQHKVYMRLSTNAGDILPDVIGLPRGLAIKVLDVEGERLPDAPGATQNFVMVNGPVFQAKTSKQFLGNLKMLADTTDKMEGGKKAASAVLQTVNSALTAVGLESSKLASLGGAPNVDPLGQTYYSATPFRYGDYIAKFSLVPVSPQLTELETHKIDAKGRPDAIRETVQEEMQVISGEWELRVQLCRNLHKQPIEDSTTEWKEQDSPFQRVAVIRVQPQDSWAPDQVEKVNEEMRFSPWLGLKAHQPLGNINRARKAPYEHSAKFRERFNGCPIHEPAGADA